MLKMICRRTLTLIKARYFDGIFQNSSFHDVKFNGKDFLKDECREESLQGISPFPPESQVKGTVKISGDELGNVKRIIEKLEKGRGIFPEHVLAVRKGIF